MRIALTADPEIPVPPLHYGGIERIIDMLAREFTKLGHEVVLFANEHSTCPVEIVRWPGKRSTSFSDSMRNAALLATHLQRRRFDIVHSFSRIAYLLPILPFGTPKLMSYQREISAKTTAYALALSWGKLEFSAISNSMINATALSGRWHMIPNGVSTEMYTATTRVAADAPLVFVGRLEEIKGPHLAIEVARLSGRRLIIAGTIAKEQRTWVAQHINTQLDGELISFIGPVDDRQKNELLGQAAALLMPILWEEPFGIVMAEAMACGTPVIGFRRGAVPEVVQNGVTGYVVDTIGEMATAVTQIGQIRRNNCRERVERLYSASVIAGEYLSLYQAICARQNRRGPSSTKHDF
jgi:glycosyltransferase involved in cell wall biosynthesis